ncbi:hypothetical protein [Roseovarius sp. 2305UL8-3]|uniref:hypothetical protein n=1 Tax=Roseovarius conchicola TaxID=3121636 RepID=UPI0035283C77
MIRCRPFFVLGVMVWKPTLRVLLTTDGCDANLARAMSIEHTNLHIQALNPTQGGFLLIKLLIGDDAPQTGFRLENWSAEKKNNTTCLKSWVWFKTSTVKGCFCFLSVLCPSYAYLLGEMP